MRGRSSGYVINAVTSIRAHVAVRRNGRCGVEGRRCGSSQQQAGCRRKAYSGGGSGGGWWWRIAGGGATGGPGEIRRNASAVARTRVACGGAALRQKCGWRAVSRASVTRRQRRATPPNAARGTRAARVRAVRMQCGTAAQRVVSGRSRCASRTVAVMRAGGQGQAKWVRWN